MLPQDLGSSLAAFCLTAAIIVTIIFEAYAPVGTKPYMPKKQWPHKSRWNKALIKVLHWFTEGTMKMIMNIRVRRRYHPQHSQICGRRTRQRKHRYDYFIQVASMTSTWSHKWSTPRTRTKQFDSDSHALMLDDGALARITNCIDNFIKSPKRVDRKVKGIKGHANTTHY